MSNFFIVFKIQFKLPVNINIHDLIFSSDNKDRLIQIKFTKMGLFKQLLIVLIVTSGILFAPREVIFKNFLSIKKQQLFVVCELKVEFWTGVFVLKFSHVLFCVMIIVFIVQFFLVNDDLRHFLFTFVVNNANSNPKSVITFRRHHVQNLNVFFVLKIWHRDCLLDFEGCFVINTNSHSMP